jgi:hypothetical protein
VGLILRHQLLVQLEQRSFIEVTPIMLNNYNLIRQAHIGKKPLEELHILEKQMQVYHHTHNPRHRGLSSLPEVVNKLVIDGMDEVQNTEDPNRSDSMKTIPSLDLRPFMNRAPITVSSHNSPLNPLKLSFDLLSIYRYT